MTVPFDIATHDDGCRMATNGESSLLLLEKDGVVFRRRGVKGFGSLTATPVEWVVARLDNVSVYFDGESVVVSRDHELRP